MLCNGENPILRIVGVEHLRWEEGTFQVPPREYAVLAFRIRGSATFHSGGKTCHVQTNDILYLPQNMGYTAEYTDTEIIGIHFVTARDDPQIELYTFQNGEQIYKLFLQACALWEKKAPGYAVYTMAHLYTILGNLLETETQAGLPKRYLQALSYINANYTDPAISVDGVCREAGMGATAFRRLFKQHHQKTPTEYITELRLEYARNLISSGLSVEAAAYESGFNDPKYFARITKKYFGCTPRALRTYGK